MSPLVLRLYVAGDGPNSAAARANLRRVLAALDPASYSIEIVDCLHDPMCALREGVLVTPTLVRLEPGPVITVIGTLADVSRVQDALGIAHVDDGVAVAGEVA
jgi:circadian clock protein KaiB